MLSLPIVPSLAAQWYEITTCTKELSIVFDHAHLHAQRRLISQKSEAETLRDDELDARRVSALFKPVASEEKVDRAFDTCATCL